MNDYNNPLGNQSQGQGSEAGGYQASQPGAYPGQAGNQPGWNQHQSPNHYQYPYYHYHQNGTQYSMHRTEPPRSGGGGEPPKKKKGGAVKAVSMMLACALLGFGGGIAAVGLYNADANQTVVYKTPAGVQAANNVTDANDFSVSTIAAKAGDSVVSITTENLVTDSFFRGQIQSGAGSGVIISEDGTIITNNHVVEGAQNIVVTLPDGTEHRATLVGRDPRSDIAVVKIDVTGLTAAVLGDSDKLSVGEFCLAIGNPMGTLGGTVTNGIISAMNREINIDGNEMNLLQMSAAVSPGNSGGGLFNAKGELIGVVNAKSSGADAEGLGFAIPVNTAMEVAQEIIETGSVSRPALNIVAETVLDQEQAAMAGYSAPGVYVKSVSRLGAAEKAGIMVGDRLVSADGTPIETNEDLTEILGSKNVGDTIHMVVERAGERIEVDVVLQQLTTE